MLYQAETKYCFFLTMSAELKDTQSINHHSPRPIFNTAFQELRWYYSILAHNFTILSRISCIYSPGKQQYTRAITTNYSVRRVSLQKVKFYLKV
jgi:hypothetical protein